MVDPRQEVNAPVTSANGGDFLSFLNSALGTASTTILRKLDLDAQIKALQFQNTQAAPDNQPNASPTATSGNSAVDSFARFSIGNDSMAILFLALAAGLTIYVALRD